MTLSLRSALLTIVLGLVAGIAGMWIGHQFMTPRSADHSLHAMVHHDLDLSADQRRQIDALESTFATRRATLESQMRQANVELATAIRGGDATGPEVSAAVQHFHAAMGALQTETIEHVFAMRRILTPAQRTTFDKKVDEALTSDAK